MAAVADDETPTVLLGYYPDLKLFAGFDLAEHANFTPGSPSVQVDITKVRSALDTGLSFARKSNDEIAVGIRPDQLMNYALNARELHKHGAAAPVHRALEQAVEQREIPDADLASLSGSRKRIVQTVSILSRAASFRCQVLVAYDHRCAVTLRQLRLVDAAHILPVGAPGSVDDVRNGIALAPTYHRAFDQGLLFLDDELVMTLNPDRADQLRSEGLDAGLDSFTAPLGRVHLPPDQRQWPDPSFIRKANAYRGV